MPATCIRQTEVPSATRLFTDFLYDFDRVSRFYRYRPAANSFADAAAAVRLSADHRQRLVRSLREQNSDAGSRVEGNLELLAKPDTVTVTTGQQVGLYGGPIFSIYKALTAIKCSEVLQSQDVRAVPVFWLATEDHDLEEVDHVWFLDRDNEPARIEAAVDAPAEQPVGGISITDPRHEAVEAALKGLPFGDMAIELARKTYPEQASFYSGFRALFRALFAKYGLILVDPMDSEIRRLAAPMLRQAIAEAGPLHDELASRSTELEREGYHAQVHVSEEMSPVFLIENERRIALRRHGNVYDRGGEENIPREELLQHLDEQPEDFSPNVLLRPVVQDFVLPTAVYVAGPAELAYLAQAEVLYGRLLERMPAVVPRAFITILDARAERYMERYELSVLDCFDGIESIRERISQKLIPAKLEQAFTDGERQINASLDAIDGDLQKFDPTLSAKLSKARKKMLYQFGKIHGAAARESLRRNERAGTEAKHLSNLIFPDKTPQERVYSVLPFVARYGEHFIDRVYQAINPDCHDHQVLAM